MHSAHSIVEHIAGFTSQRDMDLLVFSLLKSLNSILKPKRVSVIRFDHKQQPIKELTYINEVCKVIQDDISLSETLLNAIEYMQSTNTEKYSDTNDTTFLNIYRMSSERQFPTYLVISMARSMSKMDDFLISGMLAIYRNFSDLLTDSQTDELTGLANRKTFEASINRVHDLVANPIDENYDDITHKQRQPLNENSNYWLALIDIDFFKKVNDTYGHIYGDEVLIKLAHIMKRHFRGDDLVFRLGGEEFAIILRSNDQKSCSIALERFRSLTEATEFPGVGNITVSCGAVKLNKNTFHITLLDYADQALYFSKKNGRNRITFFDDLVEKGIAREQILKSGAVDLF